jgi:hypothetical protein
MGTLIKTLVAFAIGLGALYATQMMGVLSLTQALRSQPKMAMPDMKSPFKADIGKLGLPTFSQGNFDTREAQARGVISAQRRIDMEVRRAQDYAHPRIPGVRW